MGVIDALEALIILISIRRKGTVSAVTLVTLIIIAIQVTAIPLQATSHSNLDKDNKSSSHYYASASSFTLTTVITAMT